MQKYQMSYQICIHDTTIPIRSLGSEKKEIPFPSTSLIGESVGNYNHQNVWFTLQQQLLGTVCCTVCNCGDRPFEWSDEMNDGAAMWWDDPTSAIWVQQVAHDSIGTILLKMSVYFAKQILIRAPNKGVKFSHINWCRLCRIGKLFKGNLLMWLQMRPMPRPMEDADSQMV